MVKSEDKDKFVRVEVGVDGEVEMLNEEDGEPFSKRPLTLLCDLHPPCPRPLSREHRHITLNE